MTNEQTGERSFISDWPKVDLMSDAGRRDFLEALQRYMEWPRQVMAEMRLDCVLHGLMPVGDYDAGWRVVFDVIDFTGTRKNGFDLLDVGSGLAFRAAKPGQKALVHGVSGEKVTVDFDLFGGALGWSRLWFDDEEYWKIEDVAREFRARWYANQAQAHYDLISASRPDSDVTLQNIGVACLDDASPRTVRDAKTINYACASILDDTRGLGFDVSANSTFVLLCPTRLSGRMLQALEGACYNARLVVTDRLRSQCLQYPDANHYFVALPGRKIKSGNRMDLTVLSEQDILAYAETVAGWGRYGAIVGETKQLRRCAISSL